MEKQVRGGKGEKILLGLTTVFVCTLAVLSWRDVRAPESAPVTVRAEQKLPQEALLPELTPLDLNTASAEELAELPGIGPELAERIVSYRRENGPFTQVEEVCGVSGIGEKTLEKFRDRVSVDGEDGT